MRYLLIVLLIIPSLCKGYAAISFDTDNKSSAYAVNFSTENGAIDKIKSECPNCGKIYTFKKSCAAIAKGYNGYGFAIAKTEFLAKAKAIAECDKYASYCYVIAWACD